MPAPSLIKEPIMHMKFWKFWTVLIFIVFAIFTGYTYFGLFNFILAYDQTYISFMNLAILGVSHLIMLKLHMKKEYAVKSHSMVRYLGDTAVALGLIGTLIGFMIVLWSVFGPGVQLDPTDVASMTEAMTTMAQGMSSALITSLSGLITSTLISLQLVFLEE